jgi:protein-disulfide isomerase
VQRAAAVQIPTRVPAGSTPQRDGIAVGRGAVTVEAYIDFLCPFCRQFEERAGGMLDRLVADGVISWVFHPLAFLDRLSTTRYSSRAASASGCASDGGRFRDYARALFADQPEEGGPGLSDEELVALGAAVGLTDPRFAEGVLAHVYVPWVEYVTELAALRGVNGTPSVLVQGVPVPANPALIAAAVADAAR